MQTNQATKQQLSGKPKSLFRPESMEKPNRLEGMVVLRQPLALRTLFWGALVLLMLLALMLALGHYAKRQLAIGYIAPESGFIAVVAPGEGNVDVLSAHEGQRVVRGQKLAVITQRQEIAGVNDVGGDVEAALSQGLQDLDMRSSSERELSALTLERLDMQATNLQDRASVLRLKINNAEERIKIIESRVRNYEALIAEKYVSKIALDQERSALLDAVSAREDLRLELGRTERDLRDVTLQATQERAKGDISQSDLSRQKLDVRQRLLEARARNASIVSAPFSGQVSALRVHRGQKVTRDSVLLTLIPDDSLFIAELYVPSDAIASVRTGQSVYLKYKAYPFQKYGLHQGEVIEVSNATFDRRDLPLAIALPDEPLYRIRVKIKNTAGMPESQRIQLRAGMLVDADIILERRPLWKWLFKPFEDIAQRL